jgi:hypothetical protein
MIRHYLTFLPFVALCGLTFFTCQGKEVVEEINVEKVIDADAEPGMMHTVYIWLADSLDAPAVQNFEEGVRKLEGVPTVKRMFFGPAAPTPTRDVTDNTFDYALILWFDDVAGHDVYQTHPIHLQFVAEQSAKFAKVQVHDNLLE